MILDLFYLYYRAPYSWEPFGLKQALVIGGIVVAGLLVAWLSYTEIEISADNRYYRHYRSLLGRHLGRWQLLPPVVGVTLKYYSTLEKASGSGSASWGVWSNPERRHEKLLVMLSLQHSATGLILAYFGADDVNAAIDFAHDTADRFQVPVNQYLPPHLYQPLSPATGGNLPE